MAGIRVEGNTSGRVAEVTTSNDLQVALPVGTSTVAPQNAGFSTLLLERDGGQVLGTRTLVKPRMSAQNRLSVGQPVPLMQETFNGTAINTALFDTTVTTFTTAVSGGFVTLNSGNVTTANAAARLLTRQSFPLLSDVALVGLAEGQLSVVPQTNNTVEIGFFIATGTAAPTDGVFFRYDATATLKAVINHNGTEISSPIAGFSTAATRYVWKVEVEDDQANFYINNILVTTIATPATTGKPFLSESLPFQVREFNGASTPATAQQAKIASIYVGWQDAAGLGLTLPVASALRGLTGHQGQTGQTMGSTANFANSANPTAAIPTNTTAALGSGLGGQFWETDTLAVTTDGVISSFQNPAGTAAISGKTLLVYGVTIDSFVQTALTGGGYNAVWSLAFGHTAVSLATAEAAATKAPRRVPLGTQSVAAGAAALVQLSTISRQFSAPIPVLPGEFIATVRKKVGTAPSAGVVAHTITFDAVWL